MLNETRTGTRGFDDVDAIVRYNNIFYWTSSQGLFLYILLDIITRFIYIYHYLLFNDVDAIVRYNNIFYWTSSQGLYISLYIVQ